MEEISRVKYENYREQSVRLKKALNAGFYLEAIFIEYVILEDRAESIIRYTNQNINLDKKGIVFKMNKIKNIALNRKHISHKYFDEQYIENIVAWCEERNALMHALMKNIHDTGSIESVAMEGADIVKSLCNKSQLYKKALIRRKELAELTVNI